MHYGTHSLLLRRGKKQWLRSIVTCLGLGLLPAAHTQTTSANPPATAVEPAEPVTAAVGSHSADDLILNMAQAFRSKDTDTLSTLLPQVAGHPLEPWAAYWELNARLPTATNAEVQAWLQRYANTYQEDRLRNDWLLQLGQNGDWTTFTQHYPAFRMRDDNTVRCYAVLAAEPLGISREEAALLLREAWFARRDGGNACAQAATRLYAQRAINANDIWHKARLAAERNRMAAARDAVAIVDATAAAGIPGIFAHPSASLATLFAQPTTNSASHAELAVVALTRLAASNPAEAAQWLQSPGASALTTAQRNWAWGAIGRQAALNLDPQAPAYYSQASQLQDLWPEQLAWMARSAMRAGNWQQVQRAITAMPTTMQREPIWTYWLARSLQGGQRQPGARSAEATALLRSIAGHQSFYEMLAWEELHGRIRHDSVQAAAPTAQELAAARTNRGLQRALYAYTLGLPSEATREWNYSTNLHLQGGMNDRDLLAAAELACRQQWWERCINTSERSKQQILVQQRYPTPYRNTITSYSQQAGLDPAWVFGLIRQESRFNPQARSGAGASGLMQVMPGTARLVARKLGLDAAPSLNSIEGNVQLGTAYLAQQMQGEFGGSMPMASAAYNAGPGRPRRWREGPDLEGAIWVENIPFSETRNYVKKVLGNSVHYGLLLQGSPQSLYARLGRVGPAPVAIPAATMPTEN